MTTFTLVPLGNPGDKYSKTRHNVARILLAMIKDDVMKLPSCEIMVPATFMNESGKAVAEYLRYHEGREIVVLYDDKDLAFGTFRISHDRGDGGHNGLKSIIESLGTREFTRIRIGIAPKETDGKITRPPHGEAVQKYVMSDVKDDEEELLRSIAAKVLGAVKSLTEEGYSKAMERYN